MMDYQMMQGMMGMNSGMLTGGTLFFAWLIGVALTAFVFSVIFWWTHTWIVGRR